MSGELLYESLPLVLTVDEVMELLRTGRTATYEAIRRGEIPSIRVGRRIRVPRDPLLQMLAVAPAVHPLQSEGPEPPARAPLRPLPTNPEGQDAVYPLTG